MSQLRRWPYPNQEPYWHWSHNQWIIHDPRKSRREYIESIGSYNVTPIFVLELRVFIHSIKQMTNKQLFFCFGWLSLHSDQPTCNFCALDNCGTIGNPPWSQSLSPRVCLNWPRRKPSRGNWPQFIPICYNNANAASQRLIVIKWFGKHQWCHQIVLSMWKSIINHPESEAFCLGIFK